MDIAIRRLAAEDIPQAVKIIRESFATVAEEFGFTQETAPRFTAFAVTEERLNWQLEQERRLMRVLFADGIMAGYYSLLPQDRQCELNNLCVLPAHRHQRLGERLLKEAFARAAMLGCVVMEIGIVEENRRLRAWYERFGFVHTGTKEFPFFPFTCGYMEKVL